MNAPRDTHLHVSKKAGAICLIIWMIISHVLAVKRAIGVKFEFTNGTYNGIWRYDQKVWIAYVCCGSPVFFLTCSGPFPFGRGRYDSKKDLIFEGCWDFDGFDGLGFGKVRNSSSNAIQFGCWKFTMDPEMGMLFSPWAACLSSLFLLIFTNLVVLTSRIGSISRSDHTRDGGLN